MLQGVVEAAEALDASALRHCFIMEGGKWYGQVRRASGSALPGAGHLSLCRPDWMLRPACPPPQQAAPVHAAQDAAPRGRPARAATHVLL